jgi:hypothetical protein
VPGRCDLSSAGPREEKHTSVPDGALHKIITEKLSLSSPRAGASRVVITVRPAGLTPLPRSTPFWIARRASTGKKHSLLARRAIKGLPSDPPSRNLSQGRLLTKGSETPSKNAEKEGNFVPRDRTARSPKSDLQPYINSTGILPYSSHYITSSRALVKAFFRWGGPLDFGERGCASPRGGFFPSLPPAGRGKRVLARKPSSLSKSRGIPE